MKKTIVWIRVISLIVLAMVVQNQGVNASDIKTRGELEFDCSKNYINKGIIKKNAVGAKRHPSFKTPKKTPRFWVFESSRVNVSAGVGVGNGTVNASFTISGASGGGAWEIPSNIKKKAYPVVRSHGPVYKYVHKYRCPVKYKLVTKWEDGYAQYVK